LFQDHLELPLGLRKPAMRQQMKQGDSCARFRRDRIGGQR
jgi:hypothetical protein